MHLIFNVIAIFEMIWDNQPLSGQIVVALGDENFLISPGRGCTIRSGIPDRVMRFRLEALMTQQNKRSFYSCIAQHIQ